MIAIIDYGMANLRSVEKALARVGGSPVITGDPEVIARAERVVLPGVGAFCACMSNLNARGLNEAVVQAIASGKPFLGICVGLQMLFDTSSEMGISSGLGLLSGRVVRFFEEQPPVRVSAALAGQAGPQSAQDSGLTVAQASSASFGFACNQFDPDLKVPHIGWNVLDVKKESQILCGVEAGSRVYFVHSYFPIPADPSIVSAESEYGEAFCCAVETGNIAATQFHPEKSGAVGLQILRNFLQWNPVM